MKKAFLFIALASLWQCRDEVEVIGECAPLEVEKTSYSIHVYPIVSKTCAIPQCHSTDFEYGNFSKFTEVKKRADNGKLSFMIETHQMPHGFTEGPKYLTTCEIETIKKWVREGSVNN